ncbi:MAG: DNA polymerase III subunit delta [Candidatus Buchananbacteria bacterium RIFCSPHIGHO2_02_FULL_45_11b]|uniref:DNA polymerase III subunit delta n=4 Tax=Candidatus Buchananiibacteriota TaxID=1817903 RepID=A0A1G1YPC7_9BACT|nr:MAG: DNA polymerase III subunit delta [Candidatus Buchananbacteria bacterium RIFCSPHIGHO2_01_FULL_46_12]OGY50751.1 MAG: DNA polymerase III subunit delta [Candidatus Buchananbacteria bacterium RIFCSPHIGHO2_02_FULL_45_11b]OGY53297.1 MAG: DNA polymerase III subunit delta [Candidatus Buchananbacteria bacterium RIFCSPLOWO2_01_FULL_45_31]OGY55744.1 MAG: DNA polymerase III subunit delta [Candidatus Buchananbacteria bacterium RIFCSPLOWO2_02_FULL_46_11b]
MIIFLHGPDTFRSRQKLKELKEKFLKDVDPAGLNLESLNGAELEIPDFERAVSTLPFLAKKRLVIIEDLISKNKGQKIQKEVAEILEKHKSEEVIIIFWEGADFSGKAKKARGKKPAAPRIHVLLPLLLKEKYAQEFKLLDQGNVYRFAAEEFKKRGAKIQNSALKLLCDLAGSDLWRLTGEINKLSAFARGQEITPADIANLVETKLEEDVFKLTGALGQKNKNASLKLIAELLLAKSSATELLGMIAWQFRNLLLVKSFTQENGGGYDSYRMAYQLGLNPYVAQKTAAQIRYYQIDELKKIYQNLLQIDYKLKTSQIDPEVLFDLLVIKN